MASRNYVSPKEQDHLDGRAIMARQVREYLAKSSPLTRSSKAVTRWSDFHRAYVTVRR